MNIKDFCFMRGGKYLQSLTADTAHLLSPIDKRSKGKNKALLLLHGFGSSPAVYRRLLPALSMYDAIICPLLPGHGDNLQAFTNTPASEWVAAAHSVCQTMLQEYKSVDVMGLSLGGLLACDLSARLPIERLYLLAPALVLKLNMPIALFVVSVLRGLGIKFVRNRAGNIYTKQYAELTYRLLPLKTIREILTLIKLFHFAPPTCKTELFLGRFDEVVDSSKVASMFSALSNVSVHWLEHSAHVLPLEDDIDIIIKCMQRHNV